MVDATIRPRPTRCSTRSASPRRTARAIRLRTDNGERLRLQVQTVKAFLPWPKQLEMVAQHWRKIGIYGDVQGDRARRSPSRARATTSTSIHVWNNGGTELLYLFPRHAIPVDPTEAFMGPEFANWYRVGRQAGHASRPIRTCSKIFELFRSAAGQQEDERNKTAQEIWKIMVDQQYAHRHGRPVAGADGRAPREPNKLGNIPSRACIAQHCRTPGGSHPETWFYQGREAWSRRARGASSERRWGRRHDRLHRAPPAARPRSRSG